MTQNSHRLSHVHNPRALEQAEYPASLSPLFSHGDAAPALREVATWPGYEPTPLHDLQDLAASCGLARIWYKDESQRFHLKSFKALGGAYAVLRQLQQRVEEKTGTWPDSEAIRRGEYRDLLADVVISCATDGNHGRSVAWGCQVFGCRCVIYIHRDVSTYREQAMAAFGAEVNRIDGNYDDSVRTAAEEAERHGRIIVSDTSYPGYTQIPRDVMLGYSVMLAEAVAQLDGEIPTHVLIQGGVGGLAAAVCAYFWEQWGEQRPRFVVVEPEQANCLQASAQAGTPTVIEGDLETVMAGLSCGEVSQLAWEILDAGANDFMTVAESAVAPCMTLLARQEPAIVAGESAVAGLAAAIAACADPEMATALNLSAQSKVFVIGTEGDTDPELYQQMLAS